MKKRLVSIFLTITLTATSLLGCGSKADDEELMSKPEELNQNDYRGSLYRVEDLKTMMTDIVTSYMEKNSALQEENPSNYWTSNDYVYLFTDMFKSPSTQYTWYLNETQSTWDEVVSLTASQFVDEQGNSTASNVELTRNTESDYTLKYFAYVYPEWYLQETGTEYIINAKYDANHDWSSTVMLSQIVGKEPLYEAMFEYARRGNTFIIQTETERVYAVYEEAFETVQEPVLDEKGKKQKDKDGNIITAPKQVSVGNKITEFYYSKLDGRPLSTNIPMEQDEYEYYLNMEKLTKDFEITKNYSPLKDSIFPHLDDITPDWVTEKGTYAINLSYSDDSGMTVKQQNEMSHKLEVFEFDVNGKCTEHTEDIVYDIPDMSDRYTQLINDMAKSEDYESLMNEYDEINHIWESYGMNIPTISPIPYEYNMTIPDMEIDITASFDDISVDISNVDTDTVEEATDDEQSEDDTDEDTDEESEDIESEPKDANYIEFTISNKKYKFPEDAELSDEILVIGNGDNYYLISHMYDENGNMVCFNMKDIKTLLNMMTDEDITGTFEKNCKDKTVIPYMKEIME